ncbi:MULTISPECIES: hypothetical protein [Citrobacter]|uniref:hypothetical protein n=1 Tax=Citrobacter TaxID=544 RepID=UPI0020218C0E|nr:MULTISPECIES: hypothetical protein [Citrobacter]MDM3290034.1 hypothetical protein [Citrobacter sp. Ce105]
MAGKPKKEAGADTTTSVDGGDAIIDTATITTTANSADGSDAIIDAISPGDGVASTDVINGDEIGTVVPVVKSVPERRAVVFLGPYHRYSRADVAVFDAEYAEELVSRKIAAWPEDAKRALNPRRGDDDHETDIG